MQEGNAVVLELENRETLRINGVQSVEVYEDEKIILHTGQGVLEVQGLQLNIVQLDLTTGVLLIQGEIDAMIYPQERRKRQSKNRPKESFLQKMLS